MNPCPRVCKTDSPQEHLTPAQESRSLEQKSPAEAKKTWLPLAPSDTRPYRYQNALAQHEEVTGATKLDGDGRSRRWRALVPGRRRRTVGHARACFPLRATRARRARVVLLRPGLVSSPSARRPHAQGAQSEARGPAQRGGGGQRRDGGRRRRRGCEVVRWR